MESLETPSLASERGAVLIVPPLPVLLNQKNLRLSLLTDSCLHQSTSANRSFSARGAQPLEATQKRPPNVDS